MGEAGGKLSPSSLFRNTQRSGGLGSGSSSYPEPAGLSSVIHPFNLGMPLGLTSSAEIHSCLPPSSALHLPLSISGKSGFAPPVNPTFPGSTPTPLFTSGKTGPGSSL
jgi:hypothetical protein